MGDMGYIKYISKDMSGDTNKPKYMIPHWINLVDYRENDDYYYNDHYHNGKKKSDQ